VKQTYHFLIWKKRTTSSRMQISHVQDQLRNHHHTMTVQEPDDDIKLDISLCWRCVGEIPTPGGSVDNRTKIGEVENKEQH
jgi:hypothetical protein